MLKLTRKVGERINIGDDIVICVLEVNKANVRLGIEAPSRVTILRHEVFERIQAENLGSARGAAEDLGKAAAIWRQKGQG